MTVAILWGLMGGVVLGLVLVALGWRGKRLNDHPICRSCRFDLDGTLPDGTEAGQGLSHRRSPKAMDRDRRGRGDGALSDGDNRNGRVRHADGQGLQYL